LDHNAPEPGTWRARWYVIIFESDTPAGRRFDVFLLLTILASLVVIMLETIPSWVQHYRAYFTAAEWFFTLLFTAEYLLRLYIVKRPTRYIFSFYGLVDLISVLPSYLAIAIGGAQYFIVIRSLRLMRVFRVLKMMRFIGEAQVLSNALRASRQKITVFIIAVVCATVILGTMMYLIEGPENGFTSIPKAIYWCIVTLTTVGYGDISPQTPLGQILASVIMILGYGIIAVPTGIVTSEISKQSRLDLVDVNCSGCGKSGHRSNARYCQFCGEELD